MPLLFLSSSKLVAGSCCPTAKRAPRPIPVLIPGEPAEGRGAAPFLPGDIQAVRGLKASILSSPAHRRDPHHPRRASGFTNEKRWTLPHKEQELPLGFQGEKSTFRVLPQNHHASAQRTDIKRDAGLLGGQILVGSAGATYWQSGNGGVHSPMGSLK